MLTKIEIEGLAIIEKLSIEFTGGFNVITGETGAGKSILIKALSLLLGGKASADSVRQGWDQASVTGSFAIKHGHVALKILKANGIELLENDGAAKLNVRRVVTSKGRTFGFIQDTPVTSGVLKDLAASLIDIFGQNDGHRLLDCRHHLTCLDQFLKSQEVLSRFHVEYGAAVKIFAEFRTFVDQVHGKGQDVDYLEFRLNELNLLRPSAQDFSQCKRVADDARRSLVLTNILKKSHEIIDDENSWGIARRCRELTRILSSAKQPELDALAGESALIADSVDQLSFRLGAIGNAMEVSEDDIDAAESRIAAYQSLFRKHSVASVEELEVVWERLNGQVQALNHAQDHVMNILIQLQKNVKKVLLTGIELRDARRAAAQVVTQRVERELGELAMPAAKFAVQFEQQKKSVPAVDLSPFGSDVVNLWSDILDEWTEITEHGQEAVEFYLAANKGEALRPLAKVASGGEVSRIMLALKKALVVGAETCLLVFDEIDTGISGRVADIVGQKIADLSVYCQIICISHLPQVAAYGDNHYIVKKFEVKNRTESMIVRLDVARRLDEIARLLSGDKVTKASMDHAKELIGLAAKRIKARRQAAHKGDLNETF